MKTKTRVSIESQLTLLEKKAGWLDVFSMTVSEFMKLNRFLFSSNKFKIHRNDSIELIEDVHFKIHHKGRFLTVKTDEWRWSSDEAPQLETVKVVKGPQKDERLVVDWDTLEIWDGR